VDRAAAAAAAADVGPGAAPIGKSRSARSGSSINTNLGEIINSPKTSRNGTT
jgi:hypothetical protein